MLYASRGMQDEMMISGRLLPVVCGLQWCDAKRYFPGQSFIIAQQICGLQSPPKPPAASVSICNHP